MLNYLRAPFCLLLACSFFINACKSEDKAELNQINPEFSSEIQSFTMGVVSNSETIQIRFHNPEQGVQVNDLEEKSLFEFSPKIEGKAYWLDRYTLEFRPYQALINGQVYEAEFKLGSLREVPNELQTLNFSIEVIPQHISLHLEGMKAYDDQNLEIQQVKGSLITADLADFEQVRQSLTAKMNGKPYAPKWNHLESGLEHEFTIDSLPRGMEEGHLIFELDATKLDLEYALIDTLTIPSLNDFKLVQLRTESGQEQKVVLNFSDPLNQGQNLNGLVYFESGQAVNLRIINNEIHVFPNQRMTGTHVLVVNEAVQNSAGYTLKETKKHGIEFTTALPSVALLGSGTIVPKNGKLHYPFKAVNLHSVQVRIIEIFPQNFAQFLHNNDLQGSRNLVQVGRLVATENVKLESDKPIDLGAWNNFSLDLSKYFNASPGSMYRVILGFLPEHSLYPCSEAISDFPEDLEEKILEAFDGQTRNYGYYNDNFYFYHHEFNWSHRQNPCKKEYYMRDRAVGRNVMASDIGLTVKGGDSRHLHFAAAEISSTKPMSKVKLTAYSYQGSELGYTETDRNGMASLRLSAAPYYVKAEKDNDFTLVRTDDGSALSMSMFNTGGVKLKRGLNGFIYGERGVWRPGDTVFLNFILEDQLGTLPKGHPVSLEVFGPENDLVHEMVQVRPDGNIFPFHFATDPNAKTGNYLAKVHVGGATFTKSLSIETVKPNRLKIELDYPDEVMEADNLKSMNFMARWLHGADAPGLEAKVNLVLKTSQKGFENYPDFQFSDPAKPFYDQEKEVFSGVLNQEGKTSFTPEIELSEEAPGLMEAKFSSRVFEKGGGFSIARQTITYSPYNGYVGVNVPEGKGWRGAIFGDKDNYAGLVALDAQGGKRKTKVLVEVYNLGWRWWWDGSRTENLADYIRNESRYRIMVDTLEIDGEGSVNLKTNRNYWGRRMIRVTDLETGHSTGEIYYNSYSYWWSDPSAEGPGGAEMLSFSTPKTEYAIGEEVKVNLPANSQGRALVSLETGSELVDWFWVNLEDQSEITFKTTPEMSPNVYINISLIQGQDGMNPDKPLRMFGVQDIRVVNPETKLLPKIALKEVLEPESPYEVEVTEENGKSMWYTLAVVDEGLLDLTGFQTPDPWNHFYARQALGIRSWDMYAHVMGGFVGEMAGLLAVGGGADLESAESKKSANRFKPVVRVLGPFKLKPGEKAKHKLTMPNYIGSVRVMVVASGENKSYGSSEETRPVRKPLMVLGTLPRVLSPGDVLNLPVTLFAMEKQIKRVDLKVEGSELLEISGGSRKIIFTKTGEQVVQVGVKVAEKIGQAKVVIEASSGGEKAHHEIDIEVRLPSPAISDLESIALEPGQKYEATLSPKGMEGTNFAVVELSTIPPVNLDSRLSYLIRYPYGCVEQTTSSVFPQLYVKDLKYLSESEKLEIESNVKAGIDRLRNFQRSDGGLSYWPNIDQPANEWGTTYAGHFFLEAKAQGYKIPPGVLENWIKFQTNRANRYTRNQDSEGYNYGYTEDFIQAYRLFTLALAEKPAMGAMNRLRSQKGLANSVKFRLAAAYAMAGQKEIAKELIRGLDVEVNVYSRHGRSYGSSLRDRAMAVEALVILRNFSLARHEIEIIAKALGEKNWYSTQTTAFSLLALSKFANMDGLESSMVYTLKSSQKTDRVNSTHPVSTHELSFDQMNPMKLEIENTGQGIVFLQVKNQGNPARYETQAISRGLDLNVTYLDNDGQRLNVKEISQGTDFMAVVTVRNLSNQSLNELAINQLFPSGWEIRNARLDGLDFYTNDTRPVYENILDDRVYTFFNLSEGESRKFYYRLNASYQGSYYLPPVVAEAMYDDKIFAATPGVEIEVISISDVQP